MSYYKKRDCPNGLLLNPTPGRLFKLILNGLQ